MKEIWCGVKNETMFHALSFYKVQYKFEDDVQFALHTNLGSITVLDRMTGFGFRDVETGFRDTDGKFWLASGNFDVRYMECSTFEDAMHCIKQNANNCIGI